MKKKTLTVAVAALAIGGSSLAFGGVSANALTSALGYNPFAPVLIVGPMPTQNFVGPVKVSNNLAVAPTEKPKKSKKGPQGSFHSQSEANNGLGNGYEDGTPGHSTSNDPEGSSVGSPAH